MNLYLIQDPENGNFLTNRFNKWTVSMQKAHLFTTVGKANKARAELKRKLTKKYIVQEYELLHRKDR